MQDACRNLNYIYSEVAELVISPVLRVLWDEDEDRLEKKALLSEFLSGCREKCTELESLADTCQTQDDKFAFLALRDKLDDDLNEKYFELKAFQETDGLFSDVMNEIDERNRASFVGNSDDRIFCDKDKAEKIERFLKLPEFSCFLFK